MAEQQCNEVPEDDGKGETAAVLHAVQIDLAAIAELVEKAGGHGISMGAMTSSVEAIVARNMKRLDEECVRLGQDLWGFTYNDGGLPG